MFLHCDDELEFENKQASEYLDYDSWVVVWDSDMAGLGLLEEEIGSCIFEPIFDGENHSYVCENGAGYTVVLRFEPSD